MQVEQNWSEKQQRDSSSLLHSIINSASERRSSGTAPKAHSVSGDTTATGGGASETPGTAQSESPDTLPHSGFTDVPGEHLDDAELTGGCAAELP